jgi:hypothetical protein
MEFKVNFDHMPYYVFVQTQGEASDRDFDDLITMLVNSPKWVVGTRQLVDHRELINLFIKC